MGALRRFTTWQIKNWFCLIFFPLLLFPATSSANLLSNPGFEDGTDVDADLWFERNTTTHSTVNLQVPPAEMEWLDSASCKFGTCGDFDGTDYLKKSGGSSELEVTDLTVEAWVYITSLAVGRVIVSYRPQGASSDGRGYKLLVSVAGKPLCRKGSADGSWEDVTSTVTISLNTWYHLACSYDNTANSWKVVVNGATETSATPDTAGISYTNGSGSEGKHFYIGTDTDNNGTPVNQMSGRIDEVRIWSIAKTTAQINTDKDAEISHSTANLVGYWKLNEGKQDKAYDYTILNTVQRVGTGCYDGTYCSKITEGAIHSDGFLRFANIVVVVNLWVKSDSDSPSRSATVELHDYDGTVLCTKTYTDVTTTWANKVQQCDVTGNGAISVVLKRDDGTIWFDKVDITGETDLSPSPLNTFTDYTYYYKVVSPVSTSGDVLEVDLDNMTTTPGLKSWGYVRDDLNDFRVAYYNGSVWAQIGRTLSGCLLGGICLEFDGSNDYLHKSGGSASLENANYTLEATITPTTNQISMIVSYRPQGADTDGRGYHMFINAAGYLFCRQGPANGWQQLQSTVTLTMGTTYHVACTYDGTTQRLVIDGSEDNSRTPTTQGITYTNGSGSEGKHFYIGRSTDNNGTGVYYFPGRIDDVRIFNTARSEATINADKNSECSSGWTGIVGCWHLNEGTGTTTADSSGNAITLNLINMASPPTETSGWTGLGNKLRFKTQANHATLSGERYAIYFGYASETTSPTSIVWEAKDYSVSREEAKRNKPQSDSLTTEYSQATNDTSDHAFGGDQATGRQVGFTWTASSTGQYQKMEVWIRQTATTNIEAYDMIVEVWDDSGGVPGSVITKTSASTFGAEKSTGSYQKAIVFFPSKLTLTSGTKYHFTFQVNGAGSATQAISFGAQTVGSGGDLIYRTRSSSTWGSWTSDATKDFAVIIYKGTQAMADRRVTLTSALSTDPTLPIDDVPSWEAVYPTQNAQWLTPSQYHWTGTEWRGPYISYNNDIVLPTTVPREVGGFSGSSLTTLSKFNQDPMVSFPAGTIELNSPWIYDWDSPTFKMYLRAFYSPAQSGKKRHLRHYTNTHANWYQPEGAGGWADDGEVTYNHPICENFWGPPVAWMDGSTLRVVASCSLNDGDTGLQRGIAEYEVNSGDPTLWENAKFFYMDKTDLSETNQFFGPQKRVETSDGYVHSSVFVQYTASGDLHGNYYFEGWFTSSIDGYIWSSPYPVGFRNEFNPVEQQGVDMFLIDDSTIGVTGIGRYWISGEGEKPFHNHKSFTASAQVLSLEPMKRQYNKPWNCPWNCLSREEEDENMVESMSVGLALDPAGVR